jgi:hypothetical protein
MFDQADAEADFSVARRDRGQLCLAVVGPGPGGCPARRQGRWHDLRRGGRQSNFLYGSTKAALGAYLQGLRNHLTRRGVAVLTVKPGFVDTAMTWGKINPDSPMVASPGRVARDFVRAIRRPPRGDLLVLVLVVDHARDPICPGTDLQTYVPLNAAPRLAWSRAVGSSGIGCTQEPAAPAGIGGPNARGLSGRSRFRAGLRTRLLLRASEPHRGLASIFILRTQESQARWRTRSAAG